MDLGLKKNLCWFPNFKDEPQLWKKHMGFYSNSLPNYLVVLLVSYWFIGWTLDFYWFIVPAPIKFSCFVKAYWRAQRNVKKISHPLVMYCRYCLFTEIYYWTVLFRQVDDSITAKNWNSILWLSPLSSRLKAENWWVGKPRGTLLFNENYRCWQPLISPHFKFTLVSVVLESLIAQAVSYIMLKLGFDLLYEQTRLHLYIQVPVRLKHLVLEPGSWFNESFSTILLWMYEYRYQPDSFEQHLLEF